MCVERFEVLLREATSGATIRREWSKAEVLKSVDWLKRMNAKGNNIYVRPSGAHGLALLVSIRAENIKRMRSNGFTPAVSVEVGGSDFEAWIKLSEQALPARVRNLAETGLANIFGGTQDTSRQDGYGWLAGFVMNRTSQRGLKRGRYVLAHDEYGGIGTRVHTYVMHVRDAIQNTAKEPAPKSDVEHLPNRVRPLTRDR